MKYHFGQYVEYPNYLELYKQMLLFRIMPANTNGPHVRSFGDNAAGQQKWSYFHAYNKYLAYTCKGKGQVIIWRVLGRWKF